MTPLARVTRGMEYSKGDLMRKQVLVSVDRGETRVAILESKKAAARGRPADEAARRARPRSMTTGASASSTSSAAAAAPSSATSTRGASTTCSAAWRPRSSTSASRRTASCTSTRSSRPTARRTAAGAGGAGGPRISDLLKAGQEIVVQVTKDPIGTKGARLSMEVSIPGRYLVYVPGRRRRRRLAPAARQGARAAAQARLRPEARRMRG